MKAPLFVANLTKNLRKLSILQPNCPEPSITETTTFLPPFSDYPKFTVENGVRYEHRIVWKYPDGKVSEEPPASYVNPYTQASPKYSADTNLFYQGPMQFPQDQETDAQKPTGALVTRLRNNKQSPPENAHFYHNHRQQHVPKYDVASPNPEYVGSIKDSVNQQSGRIPAEIASKYSSQAQKYLGKVFSPGKVNYDDSGSYAHLLHGNPSISQYIKNPSSILNARPTYIQAGNSLIPVIILRIDGAPPVEAPKSPSVNLKALLQQYIAQYASGVSDSTREANYDFGESLLELRQLADHLKQYSEQRKVGKLRDSYGNVLHSGTYDTYKSPQKVKSVQILGEGQS